MGGVGLQLVGGFLAFFATIILYQRSDFTISHDKAWRAKELKIKATDVLESAAALLTGPPSPPTPCSQVHCISPHGDCKKLLVGFCWWLLPQIRSSPG